MPTEESQPPQSQPPAWPEMPPAWPEVPSSSSFTPSARSFADPAPAYDYGAGPVYGAEPPATQYGHGRPAYDPLARPVQEPPRGTDPFGRPSQEPLAQPVQAPDPFGRPSQEPVQAPDPFGRPLQEPPAQPLQGPDPFGRPMPADTTIAVTPPQPLPPLQQVPPVQQVQPIQPLHQGAPPVPPGQSPLAPPVAAAAPPQQMPPGQAPPLSAPPPLSPPIPPQHHHQQPGPADDPYRPFVTAGQISGPKTPPAHRQQELWNTVFGENYQAMDDYEDDERGRPVWLFALAGSVAVALIVVLVWAFTAGPLKSNDTPSKSAASATASGKPSTAKTPAAQSPIVPGLPKFEGTASPIAGRVVDPTGGISVARLGGQWQLDGRTAHVQQTYGFNTRQYVSAGMTTRGKPEFAQVMTGPLPQSLAARYTSPDKLATVIGAVVTQARQTMFAKGSKATKVAQQKIARRGLPGLLAAFQIEADKEKTTVVVAAVMPTGAQLPTIVYMQVPALKDNLLPDINTIFKSIRAAS